MWDEAITAATEGANGTAGNLAWGALDRASKASHPMGSADLVQGAPVAEVALRAGATKSLVLGFQLRAWVDEQLKVDRALIRALTKAAVKAQRAFDKAAGKAARQGGGCPPPCPPHGHQDAHNYAWCCKWEF